MGKFSWEGFNAGVQSFYKAQDDRRTAALDERRMAAIEQHQKLADKIMIAEEFRAQQEFDAWNKEHLRAMEQIEAQDAAIDTFHEVITSGEVRNLKTDMLMQREAASKSYLDSLTVMMQHPKSASIRSMAERAFNEYVGWTDEAQSLLDQKRAMEMQTVEVNARYAAEMESHRQVMSAIEKDMKLAGIDFDELDQGQKDRYLLARSNFNRLEQQRLADIAGLNGGGAGGGMNLPGQPTPGTVGGQDGAVPREPSIAENPPQTSTSQGELDPATIKGLEQILSDPGIYEMIRPSQIGEPFDNKNPEHAAKYRELSRAILESMSEFDFSQDTGPARQMKIAKLNRVIFAAMQGVGFVTPMIEKPPIVPRDPKAKPEPKSASKESTQQRGRRNQPTSTTSTAPTVNRPQP